MLGRPPISDERVEGDVRDEMGVSAIVLLFPSIVKLVWQCIGPTIKGQRKSSNVSGPWQRP
eukprot:2165920-Lingulodinium_polyedra.AAC.1